MYPQSLQLLYPVAEADPHFTVLPPSKGVGEQGWEELSMKIL